MHSQAALTIREWQRQELLVSAAHQQLLKQLPVPLPTQHVMLTRRLQSLGDHLLGLPYALYGRTGRLVTSQS